MTATPDHQPPPADAAHTANGLVRRLAARYLFVLAAVAVLIVVDQAIVQPWLVRLDSYAPVINVAGRQRMLSQRLTKAALALGVSTEADTRRARHDELRETLAQWSSAHVALRDGDPQRGIQKVSSPEIEQLWATIEPHFDAIRAAAERIIRHPLTPPVENVELHAAVWDILTHEASFLPAMDRQVKLMEDEAARAVFRLRVAALSIAVAVVLLLVGLGWFVVRPATRTIRTQVDDLESRVEQRTRELADAVEALRHEVCEREHAESRNQQLASQLAHADRVWSMGHLTVGLAHELNQPLGAVANYAEACDVLLAESVGRTFLPVESARSSTARPTDALDCPATRARLVNYLAQIKQSSLRAGDIVRRIRNFVRPTAGATTDVDINALARDVVELCRPELDRAGVELALDLTATDAVVSADPIQIQQVLVNLVQNAVQAMAQGCVESRRLEIRTASQSDAVRVDVVDTGPGFAATDPDSVFAPFHTTKAEGLGIGLSICRSIVENHDGTIWAGSVPGRGAKVSFALPLAAHDDIHQPVQSDCVCR